jgi:hypothetical protein
MKTIRANHLNGMARFAAVITALMVGMTFALTTSLASAGEINKVEVVKPKVVEKVKVPENKVEALPVVKQAVKADSSSGFVRPFGFSPFFFRPFGFNPFFDEEFFGFGD